ncbi:PIG-L deacetylase family protein [Bradyrhizobium ottawaense]|uniref:PIG-L deacetylase family protein n=1 Tax=Bradyrhizobium ottawaense TaxID=931866 RepID=UPI0027D68937|nr:PIG-L family deacetylase [Bradyrhizobium ottawaense]GMO70990.1 PIG-L family deacetylase [Bradyrhizobium ottawaense]
MANHKVVLVVAAHPDDEVLGCGGTIARLKREGWRAVLVLMTRGITGRAETIAAVSASQLAAQNTLSEETRKAAALIGFDSVISHDFPDNRMDTVAKADLAHVVAAVVAEEKPNLVLTHHPGDYNWDHGMTFSAVLMGARCSPGEASPEEIWCFEIASSSERGWSGQAPQFKPTVYVDIESTIDVKQEAMRSYVTELRDPPHPRSIDGIAAVARRRGFEVGLQWAECFEVVRKIVR